MPGLHKGGAAARPEQKVAGHQQQGYGEDGLEDSPIKRGGDAGADYGQGYARVYRGGILGVQEKQYRQQQEAAGHSVKRAKSTDENSDNSQ